MSRLLRPVLAITATVTALCAVAWPNSDLPIAAEVVLPKLQTPASQEPGALGYLRNRYIPLVIVAPTPPPAIEPQTPAAAEPVESEKHYGLATWYGAPFHGRRMRNGEVFNMYDDSITAANNWALGSKLKVINEETGQSVGVTVKDTGAFSNPILVDLSYAAFGALGPHSRGRIPVTVQLIEAPPTD